MKPSVHAMQQRENVMEWVEFMNDPEIDSDFHSMPPEKYLFGKVMHDILECLTAFKSYTDLLNKYLKDEAPVDTLAWFNARKGIIEAWVWRIHELEQGYLDQSKPLSEWLQLIETMADIVGEVPILESEYASLRLPLEDKPRQIVGSAGYTLTKLNLILRDIRAREYKRLYTLQYGDLTT
jgi:hypothetical protein